MQEAERPAPGSGAVRHFLRQTSLQRAFLQQPWLQRSWRTLLLCAAALLGFGVTLYLCAPGFLALDSGVQLEQARAFEFIDDHPVIMALTWHYLDQLAPGPVGMIVLIASLYWAGLGGLCCAVPGPVWLRALGMLAIGFSPPAFSCLPIVMKDALMHGALLSGLACLVVPSRRGLGWRLPAALLLLTFAIAVRHNAAAAAWPFLALPLLYWLPLRQRWLRLLSAGALGLLLAFLMARSVQRTLAPLAERTEFWQTVPTFDLAGMSLKAGELLVEPETELFAQGMGLGQIRQLFTADYGPQLYYCIAFGGKRCVHLFRMSRDREQLQQLSGNWLRAIREYPGAYLAHRYDFARALLTVNRGPKLLYYLDAAPHHQFGIDYPPTERSLRVMAWLERKLKAWVYQPWIYALLCVLLIPAGLIQFARAGQALTLAFGLSGSCYLLSTIVGASSTNYRYSVWMILCTLLGLAALLLSWRAREPAAPLAPPA